MLISQDCHSKDKFQGYPYPDKNEPKTTGNPNYMKLITADFNQ